MVEGRKITLRHNNDYTIYSRKLGKLCVLTKIIIMWHLGVNTVSKQSISIVCVLSPFRISWKLRVFYSIFFCQKIWVKLHSTLFGHWPSPRLYNEDTLVFDQLIIGCFFFHGWQSLSETFFLETHGTNKTGWLSYLCDFLPMATNISRLTKIQN